MVDMKVGGVIGEDKQINLEKGEIGLHSTPTGVNDTIIVGSSMFEGLGQPSKQGWLYVLDRITGQPIWPINETPVPQTDIPGENTAATQPIPSNPPPYSRTFISTNDLVDFTPALRAQALANLKRFRWEQSPYVPPVGPDSPLLGAINIGNTAGGVNWPGSGFDPETSIFYTMASMNNVTPAKYEEEEFEQIRVENQKTRLPRWDADPNYGIRGTNNRKGELLFQVQGHTPDHT